MIKLKRVYDPYDQKDGFRILVDRLWPRGIKKCDSHIDFWPKDVAPSTELRKWFNHEPEKWVAFSRAYLAELKHAESVNELADRITEEQDVTLVSTAKDERHTHALILLAFLKKLINK